MNDLERAINVALRGHMSEILAQSVRRRAQSKLGIGEGRLRREDLVRLLRELTAGVRLFVPADQQPTLLRELSALETESAPAGLTLTIRNEADVSRARLEVRDIARRLGATSFAAQRAATATSELVRNIIMYAGAGRFTYTPAVGPPPSLRLEATDRGPGIPDLELVLSGAYRSRTGMGRGLIGVQRLADDFNITTGPSGTRIIATFTF